LGWKKQSGLWHFKLNNLPSGGVEGGKTNA
jgi:hypothetical protein